MDYILCQAAVQAEEGDPDGDPQKQGNQRGVDTPQQRAPTATQGQPTFYSTRVCVCVRVCEGVRTQQSKDKDMGAWERRSVRVNTVSKLLHCVLRSCIPRGRKNERDS